MQLKVLGPGGYKKPLEEAIEEVNLVLRGWGIAPMPLTWRFLPGLIGAKEFPLHSGPEVGWVEARLFAPQPINRQSEAELISQQHWGIAPGVGITLRGQALKGRDNRRRTRPLYMIDPQDGPWNGDRFPGKKNYLVTRYLDALS